VAAGRVAPAGTTEGPPEPPEESLEAPRSLDSQAIAPATTLSTKTVGRNFISLPPFTRHATSSVAPRRSVKNVEYA